MLYNYFLLKWIFFNEMQWNGIHMQLCEYLAECKLIFILQNQ